MTPWVIHPAALQELSDSIRYYAAIDADLALAFESAYLHHRQMVLENPLLYSVREQNVRRVNLLPRFKEHYMAYMLWHDNVVILAVAHAKRRPNYFDVRVDESRQLFQ